MNQEKKRKYIWNAIAVVFLSVPVVSIIVLAFIPYEYNGRRHDGRRIADIKQIQVALEFYYNAHGEYPNHLNLLEPEYIASVPIDPATEEEYYYEKRSDGYYLKALLDNSSNSILESDINPGNEFYEVEVNE